jgi:hypothetical protein
MTADVSLSGHVAIGIPFWAGITGRSVAIFEGTALEATIEREITLIEAAPATH